VIFYGGGGGRQADDRDVIWASFTSRRGGVILPPGRRAQARNRGMRILVVEDEARIRAFLARAFESEGFVVDVASDGEHGLERALSAPYDGMVLDLLLPGKDGLEVLRQLQLRRHD